MGSWSAYSARLLRRPQPTGAAEGAKHSARVARAAIPPVTQRYTTLLAPRQDDRLAVGPLFVASEAC
jgi:hypothetical protein